MLKSQTLICTLCSTYVFQSHGSYKELHKERDNTFGGVCFLFRAYVFFFHLSISTYMYMILWMLIGHMTYLVAVVETHKLLKTFPDELLSGFFC